MSRTTVYAFYDGKPAKSVELPNAWGSGPMIWDALIAKYRVEGDVFSAWKNLCAAERDGKIKLQPWERIVLHATYENALVKRDDLETYAAAAEQFDKAHHVDGRVCHLRAMGEVAREALKDGAEAIGFHLTSVADNPWWVRPDNEDEDGRPYDLAVDTRHWFVDCATPAPTGQDGRDT